MVNEENVMATKLEEWVLETLFGAVVDDEYDDSVVWQSSYTLEVQQGAAAIPALAESIAALVEAGKPDEARVVARNAAPDIVTALGHTTPDRLLEEAGFWGGEDAVEI